MCDTMRERPIVLLVDDVPANIDYLSALLADDYRVIASKEGDKALELAERKSPDLILLDILMPGMDGFEVITRLKSNPATLHIPVIFISSMNDRETIVHGFQAGAQDYISKPFEPAEFMARIFTQVKIKHQTDKLSGINEFLEKEVQKRTRELSRANRLLTHANRRLNNYNVVKSRFLNVISHELRTPLTIIVQYVDFLREHLGRDDLSECFNHIQLATRRLEGLSKKALLLTQLNTDSYPLDLEKTSVEALIGQSLDACRESLDANRLRVDLDVRQGFVVKADVDLIRGMIDDLLDNAVRYSPPEGRIRIRSESDVDGNHVVIEDQGPGFPDEILSSEGASFTLGEDPVKDHLGLSLSIAFIIMRAHMGVLRLLNSPQGGAVVRISFQQD